MEIVQNYKRKPFFFIPMYLIRHCQTSLLSLFSIFRQRKKNYLPTTWKLMSPSQEVSGNKTLLLQLAGRRTLKSSTEAKTFVADTFHFLVEMSDPESNVKTRVCIGKLRGNQVSSFYNKQKLERVWSFKDSSVENMRMEWCSAWRCKERQKQSVQQHDIN